MRAERVEPRLLAQALVHGARAELDLTPKPGLVDRHDNGSHPDLDHSRMTRSIDLLPQYYEELIGLRTGAGRRAGAGEASERAMSLAACIDAGRRAEFRMEQAIGSNAHRGYIFLSGLVLLAACDLSGQEGAGRAAGPTIGGPPDALRRAVFPVASAFFQDRPPSGGDRPGARVRKLHRLGGVRAEALAGLPSVFEAGLPAHLAARESGSGADDAAFRALAALMQRVEDTTAVMRCGLAGLARLRRDGAVLQALLERGDDPRPVLATWNEEYRVQRLTMGGVADCLALVLALAEVVRRAGTSG